MKRVECCITHVTGRPWEGRLRRECGWEGVCITDFPDRGGLPLKGVGLVGGMG